jgi:hypothetical protein
MAARKKVKVRARPKTGLAGAPLNDGFEAFKYYVHMEADRKEVSGITKAYVKQTFSKDDAKAILATPEYNFYMYSLHGSAIYWVKTLEQELPENYSRSIERINEFYTNLIEPGKKILEEKAQADTAASNVVVLTPQQRLFNKIQETVMTDLDDLEDAWIDGEEPEFDMYQTFKKHGLSGSHTAPVLKRLEGWLLDYEDAYHKRCEQAVEGYSHVPRPVLRRRIKLIQDMVADLDRVKASAKATRKTRTPKPRAADKQVANIKYLKEDMNFKITSILPITIVGAMRLYVFNVKTKELTEYISNSSKGFEVKGTTLQNVGEESRKVKLRKPDEILPIVQNKTPKQIDNTWQTLTTKTSSPNGRLNSDCVLLRVLDR